VREENMISFSKVATLHSTTLHCLLPKITNHQTFITQILTPCKLLLAVALVAALARQSCTAGCTAGFTVGSVTNIQDFTNLLPFFPSFFPDETLEKVF
jgi:hypothetical protein